MSNVIQFQPIVQQEEAPMVLAHVLGVSPDRVPDQYKGLVAMWSEMASVAIEAAITLGNGKRYAKREVELEMMEEVDWLFNSEASERGSFAMICDVLTMATGVEVDAVAAREALLRHPAIRRAYDLVERALNGQMAVAA